ncbi:MAG: histidinol dehydrogenase [Chitinispirillales bacterium]|jgi:histidinol dehydrogenase|nr:histidinol dehydrogenase [Chitinispirillales bacterium]
MAIQIPVVRFKSKESDKILSDIENGRRSRNEEIEKAVREILDNIARNGNKALFEYCKKFDGRDLTAKNVRLQKKYISSQAQKIDKDLARTIKESAKRIFAYHEKQKIDASFSLKTDEGVLRQKILPLRRVGLYIPGGHTVYPSTVLMNAIPAKIAGVKEIVAVTPRRESELNPALAFVFDLLEIDEIYQIGGAQAIAALAFGTQTIPAVDKIVGPGNSFVATAKKMVYGTVDIDCVAGPSEVMIWADESANPTWAALDLLSQAEHGSGDETAVLLSESADFAQKVKAALLDEIEKSPVKNIFENLSKNAICVFITANREESAELINKIGPEHLEISTKDPENDLEKIENAAAIFLGNYSPVPVGDYFVGTNHVLPTAAASRYASPLGTDDFRKRISIAKISQDGLKSAAQHISRFARAENFIHHALTVERRVEE